MKRKDFIRLKAGLLCQGVKTTPESREAMVREYPNFFDKGLIDAANINIYGSNLCVNANENFAKNSPYTLVYEEGKFSITGGAEPVTVKFFDSLPKTDTILDKIARLHAEKTINIWPSTACCYDVDGKKCAFCSLEKTAPEPLDLDYMAGALKKLLEGVPDFTLNFSGGTFKSPDHMARYWLELVKRIREFSNCPIAIELAPPTDLSLLDELKAAGLNVIIMNLEVADENLRKQICPGKSSITKEHYYKAFRRVVELFGWGQVSSVLIGGIQPKEDIINEIEEMAKIGVFPTIMPFRPVDGCALRNNPTCDPDELVEMSEILGGLLRKYNLKPYLQEGCTKCGGCSIENDCFVI
ncbi:MAG: radical SAM protein [Eubacteriales bacterium]|jgi:biotin synthase-related radical SAM superfamily protein